MMATARLPPRPFGRARRPSYGDYIFSRWRYIIGPFPLTTPPGRAAISFIARQYPLPPRADDIIFRRASRRACRRHYSAHIEQKVDASGTPSSRPTARQIVATP